jgi:hypothetical protein
MFDMFMQGKTCEDIRKTTPEYSLGQIAHARVLGDWDRKVEEHTEALLNNVVHRVQTVSLESINYICDWLSAHHKAHSDKMMKYFLSGDSSELDTVPNNLKAYAEAVQLLRSLTGQDKTTKGSDLPPYRVAPTIKQEGDPTPQPQQQMPMRNVIDAEVHSNMLKALDEDK